MALHLCAMQRYANDFSSQPESQVDDHVCILECFKEAGQKEGRKDCMCVL